MAQSQGAMQVQPGVAHPFSKFTPAELEFAAADQLIDVVPTFTSDSIAFLAGTFGPFRPLQRTTVPLWLAVELRKQGMCEIQAPDWLNKDALSGIVERERREQTFQEVPFHYQEIANCILAADSNAVGGSQEDILAVRTLLKDLEQLREEKVRGGLKSFAEGLDEVVVKLPGISAMELNVVRPVFLQAIGRVHHLQRERGRAEEASQNLQQSIDDEDAPGL